MSIIRQEQRTDKLTWRSDYGSKAVVLEAVKYQGSLPARVSLRWGEGEGGKLDVEQVAALRELAGEFLSWLVKEQHDDDDTIREMGEA